MKWIVPIYGDHAFELELDSCALVHVTRPVMTAGAAGPKLMGRITVGRITPVEACQLGQALLEASRDGGALMAKSARAIEGRAPKPEKKPAKKRARRKR